MIQGIRSNNMELVMVTISGFNTLGLTIIYHFRWDACHVVGDPDWEINMVSGGTDVTTPEAGGIIG